MRLPELLRDLDVLEWSGDPDVEIAALTHDSRRVEPGACFACLAGSRSDGHEFASEAVERGAAALLVERLLAAPVSQARVADVRRVLGPISARFFGDPSRVMRCLGVTGTNGKTTTVHLLAKIGRAAGLRVGVVGTLGTHVEDDVHPGTLTTPEATDLQAALAAMRDEGAGLVAIEVSSHALNRRRVDGTRFAAACFTNLSHDHLDEHGSMEEYFATKERLFTSPFTATTVTNLDDPFGARLAEDAAAAGGSVCSYAIYHPQARVTPREVVYARESTRYELVDSATGAHGEVRSPLVGELNLANQLAAAATAISVGVPFSAVIEGLGTPLTVAGRLERIDEGQPFTVLVDYAHTPDALSQVLDAARLLGDRVLLVFGCGGDRDRAKRPMMGAVAGRGADVVVLTSDNPRSEDPETIAAEVAAGIPPGREHTLELDRRLAIRDAFAAAGPGDVVVIAGKGHETGQTTGAITVPFDDRVVAREELGSQPCG